MQQTAARRDVQTDAGWLVAAWVGCFLTSLRWVGKRCDVAFRNSHRPECTPLLAETHSHEAKSRWDRGWWIMMDDDHGFNQNPRVGRGRNRLSRHASFRSFSTPRLTICCSSIAACWVGLRLPERVRASCCSGEKVDNFLDLDMAFGGRMKTNNDFSLCGTAARARGRVIILVNSGHT